MLIAERLKVWLALVEEQVTAQVNPCLVPFTLLLISVLPLIVCSVILPTVLVPTVAILSVPFLYFITHDTFQKRLFKMDRTQAHLGLIVPLEALIAGWGLLMLAIGKAALIPSVIGLHLALLLLAIAPVLRFRLAKQTRKWSYARCFFVVGSIVVFLEGSTYARLFM